MLSLHPPLVYVLVRPLPDRCQPAQVIRHAGSSLVWVHPDSLCAELAFWTRENLTDAERRVMREAWGMSIRLDEPPADDMLDGTVGAAPVPPTILLPLDRLSPIGKQRRSEGAA